MWLEIGLILFLNSFLAKQTVDQLAKRGAF